MAQKRRKAAPPANTGRSCVICKCHITPQWRRVMWKGRERDACNRCGISLRDFTLRTDRDFKREPTNHELVAWGQGRTNSQSISSGVASPVADSSFVTSPVYDVEAVAAAEILMEISRSSRSAYHPSSQYPSSSSTSPLFSSESPTPFSSSAPKATISLEAESSSPSSTRTHGLVVEVEPTFEYDAYSDLGLTVSSSSPTWSTFEVSTPISLSSYPNEILVVPAPKKLVKGCPAYELR